MENSHLRVSMEINELVYYLEVPRDIAIVSHRNPDGDAVGSTLALGRLLRQAGHTVHMILPSEFPPFFNWMPDIDRIWIYDIRTEESIQVIKDVDLIWMLDFNSLDRIDRMGEEIHHREDAKKVLIDHHLDPEPIADLMVSEIEASSTSELVFDFIRKAGWESQLDREMGIALMTGILTDTGSFKYNTRPELFHKVADLLSLGIDLNDLQIKIFNTLPVKFLRILGYCLHKRMEIIEEYNTGIIALSKEDFTRFDIQRGDTEGIVNYLLMIQEVKFAILITEQPTIIKLSFRSKGEFSVQAFARDNFKGGGHKNAAGGATFGTLSKTVKKVKSLLPRYEKSLKSA